VDEDVLHAAARTIGGPAAKDEDGDISHRAVRERVSARRRPHAPEQTHRRSRDPACNRAPARVIIPDVNLLVYAHNRSTVLHEKARAWWEDFINREQPVALPWAVTLGFVRLVTHPSVLVSPLAPHDALAHVRIWFEQPSVRIVEPGPRHVALLDELFQATGVGGKSRPQHATVWSARTAQA